MGQTLEEQLADFLRRIRGDKAVIQFSRTLGLPPSTLCRLRQSLGYRPVGCPPLARPAAGESAPSTPVDVVVP